MNRDEKLKEQMETLKKIRETIGMNRSEFSRYMDIPVRTLEEWEAGRRKMPDYVLRLLTYYIKMEQAIKDGEVIVKEEQKDGKDK